MDLSQIAKRTSQIDELTEKIKEQKGMLKAELDNDEAFAEISEKVKDLSEQKKALREQILAKEVNQQIYFECEENSEELKTLKEILTVELVEYYRKNNSNEFLDSHGVKRQFVLKAHLAKKKENDWDEQPRDIDGKFKEE